MTVKNPYIPPNYGMVSPEIDRLKALEAAADAKPEVEKVAPPVKTRKGK